VQVLQGTKSREVDTERRSKRYGDLGGAQGMLDREPRESEAGTGGATSEDLCAALREKRELTGWPLGDSTAVVERTVPLPAGFSPLTGDRAKLVTLFLRH
jgi:hypothetical protein